MLLVVGFKCFISISEIMSLFGLLKQDRKELESWTILLIQERICKLLFPESDSELLELVKVLMLDSLTMLTEE